MTFIPSMNVGSGSLSLILIGQKMARPYLRIEQKIPSATFLSNDHTGGQVLLYSMAFIKRRLKTQKVKSAAIASKKIKTNHHEAFCTTHRHLSHA